MVVPDRIIEIIKARCFTETGLKNFVTDRDYNILSDSVAKATGCNLAVVNAKLTGGKETKLAVAKAAGLSPIGVNTWKRIFGHLLRQDGTRYDTSPKTAKIIAEYLGCDSWEQVLENEEYLYTVFVIKKAGGNNNSVLVQSNTDETSILISSLRQGDVIEVKSHPNKVLRLKYISATSNSRWYRIIDTVGSNNLHNLDEIEIPFLQKNKPLTVSQLKRNGECKGEYHAGSKQVVYSVTRIKE